MEVPTANKLNSKQLAGFSDSYNTKKKSKPTKLVYLLIIVQVEVVNLGIVAGLDDHRIASLDKVWNISDRCGDSDLE